MEYEWDTEILVTITQLKNPTFVHNMVNYLELLGEWDVGVTWVLTQESYNQAKSEILVKVNGNRLEAKMFSMDKCIQ